MIDGVAESEIVEGAALPWRKVLSVESVAGSGVVQIMAAASGESAGLTCSISVDGAVVHRVKAPDEFSSVSCSSAMAPRWRAAYGRGLDPRGYRWGSSVEPCGELAISERGPEVDRGAGDE